LEKGEKMKKFVVVLIASTVCFGVTFTSGPEASLQGGKITITFTASASTDVEVAILDAQGKIIRHLAAGVLGGTNPPPEPLQAGLSQTLVWDGFDDYYASATGGPFKVRVRLGLNPTFEKSISTKVFPADFQYYDGTVRGVFYMGLPVDPKGDILTEKHPAIVRTYMHVVCGLNMSVCDETDEIFFKIFKHSSVGIARINGITEEKIGPFAISPRFERDYWGEPLVSWDGKILYHCSSLDQVHRYTLLGKSNPWPGTNSDGVSGIQQGWQHSRGMAAGPDGSVYVLHHHEHRATTDGRVTQIGPDGNIARSEFIIINAEVGGGIKVDLAGNIFVGARVKPKGLYWPAELNGTLNTGLAKAAKVNSPPASFTVRAPEYWAKEFYGSLLKFGPSGGSILRDSSGNEDLCVQVKLYPAEAQGLLGMYFGLSHVSTHMSPAYGGAGCVCNTVRFDVDRFGRPFIPDGFRASIVVLDNNMNEILRLRNRDVTEAAIGYPHQMEVTDRAMYVADQFNNYIHVFLLGSEAEQTIDLPAVIEEGSQVIAGQSGIQIFPNPFNSLTTIAVSYQLSAVSNYCLRIFDVNGKLVMLKTFYSLPSTRTFEWNAGSLPAGIYIAKIRFGNKTVSKLLFKTK
jgi:hypothetical protein